MKIHYNLLLIGFIGCMLIFECDLNDQSGKIPITSTSEEAVEWYQKGFSLENKYDIEGAEQAYYKALDLDSTFALAHLRIAMIRDDFDRRRIHLAKAMNNLEEVSEGERLLIETRNDFYGTPTEDGMEEFDYAQQLVELYPDDEYANYLFGFLHIHHGKEDPPNAIRYLNKAKDINPGFVKPYEELAYAYMLSKEYANAEEITQKNINLVPDKANPYNTYAEILMKQNKYEESITAYQKVLEIDPSYPWAIMGIAGNLNFLGRHQEARSFLTKLEPIDLSDYEERHKWRAFVTSYIDEGDLDSAIVILNQQNTIARANQDYTQAYFSYQRATRLYFENGQPDQGMNNYYEWKSYVETEFTNENTIQRVRDSQNYYEAFGHFVKGEFDLALNIINANYSEPNDEVLILMARIFLKNNRVEEARELLNSTDNNDPFNRYLYAKTNELLGNNDVAQREYEALLSLNLINEIDYSLTRALILGRL